MQEMNEKFKPILKVIEKFCFDREDPIKAIHNMRDFPEGYDAFGIDNEEIKVLRDRILEDFKPGVADIADLGKILFKTGKYEFGTLAIMLIKKHRPRMDGYVLGSVKEWLDNGVENWAHADLLAIKIVPVFFELELCNLETFAPWRESRSKWTRRTAVMCLNSMKKALDAKEILEFITPLLSDREKVVQQAIGIILGNLWHKAHEPVEEFLAAHKDQMDSLALKNATARLPLAKAKQYRKVPPRHKAPQRKPSPKYRRAPKS